MKTLIVATVAALVVSAVPARAELVFFSSGRALSVASHRVDGNTLILQLRGGGEVVFDSSVITRIAPDEVPYPDPESDARRPVVASQVTAPLDPNAERYTPIIDRLAAEQGVDAQLVRAMIRVESNYQPRARSRKGAMGLMQLMPETARQYAVSDPYDPAANIEGGIKYLKSLLERYPRELALAAYNAGEAAVQRFGGIPPYAETRDYVTRIIGLVGR